MGYETINVTPVTPRIGAAVDGLTLAKPLVSPHSKAFKKKEAHRRPEEKVRSSQANSGCVLSGARRVHPVIVGWSTPQIAPSCPAPSMIIPDACSLSHGLGQLPDKLGRRA
jgi:hypothetical protein